MSANIKWVKNSRVKRNSKILKEDIVERESDAKTSDVVVAMTDVTKEHPIINIHFPQKSERRENRIQNHTTGDWITKSWLETKEVVATINTQENYIHFNRTRFTPEQLNEVMEVINKVKEIA
jgi:hypothetical protein